MTKRLILLLPPPTPRPLARALGSAMAARKQALAVVVGGEVSSCTPAVRVR